MPGPAHGVESDPEVQARLARSERGVRQLVDGIVDAVLLIDWDGVVVMANPGAERLFGVPQAALAGVHVESLLAPSARAPHRARREAWAADPPIGPVAVLEGVSVLDRRGVEVPVRVQLTGIELAEAPVMCATFRDISAERNRERQDAALRRIAAAAGPDLPIGTLLTMMVEEAAALLGAEKALVGRFDSGEVEIVGSYGDDHTQIGDRIPAGSGSTLLAVARTGAPATLAYDDLPSGDPIRERALSQDHHHAAAVPITVHTRLWGGLMVAATREVPPDVLDALTRFAEYAGAVIGAAQSRAAAEAVSASEAQLRAALDAGRMGAWAFDPEGSHLTVDDNIRTLFGIGSDVPDESVRLALSNRVHPDDRERVAAGFARVVSQGGPSHHVEYRIILPGGVTRWIETWGRVARDGDGTPGRFTGVMVDVTDQRQAGERQLRSQKLEAIGTLAGGIAHDFNNLLQVIGGNVGLARADLRGDDPAQEHLGTVERATERAAELVGRILAYSRPGDEAERAPVALDGLVEDALDLLRPTLPAMIELRSWYGGGLPTVSADRAGITQVVTNLATNAAQAIGRRAGTIEFRLEAVQLEEEETRGTPELSAGAWVRLTVSDDGPGMDAETLERAFDPFFTTKDPGTGTGLGLSIVHSVMAAHGGAVSAYSEQGVGTAFRLYFPIEADDASAVTPVEEPPLPARTGRILFVDDEPDLVALHERSLGRVGHEVAGFTDPRVALERFREDPDGFDAVVTDLSMPGITGLDLAREILALRPDIPVLIASGYIPPDERLEAEELGVREMLPKPSPLGQLRDALTRALGG